MMQRAREEKPEVGLKIWMRQGPCGKNSGIMIVESLFEGNLLLLVLPPSGVQITSSAFFQRSSGWLKTPWCLLEWNLGIVFFLGRVCPIFTLSNCPLPPQQHTLHAFLCGGCATSTV